jgi:CheY-like chemotaxis protein
LSLVRTLTELHGGTATAQSDGLGKGSEFSIRLPSASPPDGLSGTTDSRADAHASSSPSARVLLVDDHNDVVEGLSRLLSVLGYEVRAAHNPLDALELARTFRPQIAILDIGLPTMDGYTLARELRSLLADSPPMLIALSGYGQPQDRHRSDESGFVMHLVKPIDIDELVAALTPPSAIVPG